MENQSPNPNYLQSEARMLAMSEADPAIRLEMLDAMIAEGDYSMVDFAIAALGELPDTQAEDAEAISQEKITSAQVLADTLASQKLFDRAETVISLLENLDPAAAVQSMVTLLEAGFAGNDDRFLRLDFAAHILEAQVAGNQPHAIIFSYINGLAAYGINLLDPETEASSLFCNAIAAVPDRTKQDYHYNAASYAYTVGGHIEMALAMKDIIQDPYWRCIADLKIAQRAQENEGGVPVAETMLTELCNLLDAVSCCNGGCGRFGCNPQLDVREIEIGMADILAKQGDIPSAHQLVGAITPAFAYDQALVHAQIYLKTGDMVARQAALEAVVCTSAFHKESLAGDLIREIGIADYSWNNVVPSLEADCESVPLICWEVHSLYARKHRIEQDIESNGLGTDRYRAMELLGIDPSTYLNDMSTRRSELRDYALAELAKLTASTAPITASNLIRLIEKPSEKVRAMVGVGRKSRS